MIKLFQYKEKKTIAVLSLTFGLIFGGCSEFEVVELKDQNIQLFKKTYAIESPEFSNYFFKDVFLMPLFPQSLEGYFGSYDLRLVVYAKTARKEVDVVRASIPQLNVETAFRMNFITEHFSDISGLYYEHKVLISEINGTDLYEAGSEGRTVDVIITAQIGDETKTFNYSFSATKIKVAVPIH